jgi:hypothetical protein
MNVLEIQNKLNEFLEDSTEELKEKYEEWISKVEYEILQKSSECEYKSKEWFDFRREAFSTRGEIAKKFLPMWIEKYGSTKNCPVQYQDTLNIPFKQIKEPK